MAKCASPVAAGATVLRSAEFGCGSQTWLRYCKRVGESRTAPRASGDAGGSRGQARFGQTTHLTGDGWLLGSDLAWWLRSKRPNTDSVTQNSQNAPHIAPDGQRPRRQITQRPVLPRLGARSGAKQLDHHQHERQRVEEDVPGQQLRARHVAWREALVAGLYGAGFAGRSRADPQRLVVTRFPILAARCRSWPRRADSGFGCHLGACKQATGSRRMRAAVPQGAGSVVGALQGGPGLLRKG